MEGERSSGRLLNLSVPGSRGSRLGGHNGREVGDELVSEGGVDVDLRRGRRSEVGRVDDESEVHEFLRGEEMVSAGDGEKGHSEKRRLLVDASAGMKKEI